MSYYILAAILLISAIPGFGQTPVDKLVRAIDSLSTLPAAGGWRYLPVSGSPGDPAVYSRPDYKDADWTEFNTGWSGRIKVDSAWLRKVLTVPAKFPG
jgi:hypothetical protein